MKHNTGESRVVVTSRGCVAVFPGKEGRIQVLMV
jgi:hypothetical protein